MTGILLKNWPYKIFAVLIAFTIWSHVQNVRNPVTDVPAKVPVKYTHLHKGYVANVIPEEILVTLQGPKLQVDEMNIKKDIMATVDLANLDVGTHRVPIKIVIPEERRDGVAALFDSKDVAVTIESVSSRTIGIEVKMKSPPPIGWTLSDPTIQPSRAIVSGRSSLVDRVARLAVTTDATPLKPSIDDYVHIKALDARGREIDGVRVAPDGARVALKLVEAPAGKSVFVSPTVTGQPQFPYQVTKVSVTPNSVTIKGRPESLVNTSTLSTDEVDVTGATGNVVRRTTLRVPPGLDIDGPRTVKVTVKIESLQNR